MKPAHDDEPDLVLLEGHMEYNFCVANLFGLVFSWFHVWLKYIFFPSFIKI